MVSLVATHPLNNCEKWHAQKRQNHIPKDGKINSKLSWWKNYSLLFKFTLNSTTLYLRIRFEHHITSGAKNTIFMIQRLQCSMHPSVNSQFEREDLFKFFFFTAKKRMPWNEKKLKWDFLFRSLLGRQAKTMVSVR